MRASAKARWCLPIALFDLIAGTAATADDSERIALPPPVTQGLKSVEQAPGERRSQRRFTATPLSLTEPGQTLWAAQNIYLQCTARGLGTTLVGAFDDDELAAILDLPTGNNVFAVMPIGYPDKR